MRFLPLLLLSFPAFAQPPATFSFVDSVYRDAAAREHMPGLSWGILIGGRLVHTGATGFANVEAHAPMRPETVSRIASMSKSFAGLAILLLRDEGRLSLDEPVTKYLPELATTQTAAPIRIRHLLTHTAGLPEDNPWGDRQLQITDSAFLNFLKNGVSLSTRPGTGYEYSNLGFAILGALITRVSGEPYTDFIRRRIWQPLGMTHTFWEYGEVPAGDLAFGYRRVGGDWVKQALLHSGAYGVMGGVLTSIDDFARYMALFQSAWRDEKNAVASPATLREMQGPGLAVWMTNAASGGTEKSCPLIASYNDGLRYTQDCRGRVSVGHSGGLPGYGSNWILFPQYGVGVVTFANLTYAGTADLNRRIADTLIARLGIARAAQEASPILEERKNQILPFLPDWKGAEASGIFAENFFLDYFPDSLRREARELFAKAGRVRSAGPMIPENALRGYCLLHGEHGDIRLYFTLSPEKDPKIQAYALKAAGDR